MSCAETFLKSVSGIFTVYYLIVSLAFLVYGGLTAYIFLVCADIQELEHDSIAVPSIILIVFGGILFITVILGCCAVCREKTCCVETYAIVLIVLAFAQTALGVYSLMKFTYTNLQLHIDVNRSVQRMFDNYAYNPQNFDNAQQWLGCCGMNSYEDWKFDNMSLPLSCCPAKSQPCNSATIPENIEGCADKLLLFTIGTNIIIGWSCIVVAITEVLGGCLGLILGCSVWRRNGAAWI